MTSSAEAAFARFARKPGIEESKFFGFRSLTVVGKTVVVLFDNKLVFKLEEVDRQAALRLHDAALWNPYGRTKKNWVQLPPTQAQAWPKFFSKARELLDR